MTNKLNTIIESRVLDETEQALADFVQSAINVGLSKGQMAVMLQKKADSLVPPIMLPEGVTVQ